MSIIEKIFSRQELIDNPPVLLDIGASGEIYPAWRPIAKYSICLAFDADAREFKYIEGGSAGYKKLYVYNRIVSVGDKEEESFYLTKSPYCSSLLEPNMESLADWSFADLFKIEKVTKLKTVNLSTVIKELKLRQIDWFKTDSQGTDLRLFDSLGNEIIKKVLIADFEPGIINAYKNEDKLFDVMAYMENLHFWVNELSLPRAVRINKDIKEYVLNKKLGKKIDKILNLVLKSSPVCGEISYFNSFKDEYLFNKRDHLLALALSYIKKQFGFALEIADKGEKRFSDPIFTESKNIISDEIKAKINKSIFKAPLYKIMRLFKKTAK